MDVHRLFRHLFGSAAQAYRIWARGTGTFLAGRFPIVRYRVHFVCGRFVRVFLTRLRFATVRPGWVEDLQAGNLSFEYVFFRGFISGVCVSLCVHRALIGPFHAVAVDDLGEGGDGSVSRVRLANVRVSARTFARVFVGGGDV